METKFGDLCVRPANNYWVNLAFLLCCLAALCQLVYVIIDTIATNYQLKVLATNYLFVVEGKKYLEMLQKQVLLRSRTRSV